MNERHGRNVLALILAGSIILNAFHLHWGLPNENTTWAADALTPLSPLSIGKKEFSQWNSGWFYFKYPIGHHMLLLAAYAPYLIWLYTTGQLSGPRAKYPYGFSDPDWALTVLALIGRVVSVLMASGAVWIVFVLGREFLDPFAAAWAAAAAACSPALIYYAHTTNLDVPVMFWMLLSLLFAIRLTKAVRVCDCVGLGMAAGMALATKEFALGMLVALPLIIAAGQARHLRITDWNGFAFVFLRLILAAGVALLIYGLATNAFFNPAGVFNRWRFLTNTLPKDLYGVVVPRPSMINPTTDLATHLRFLRELGVALIDAVGLPLIITAVGGLILALLQIPRVAIVILTIFVIYYWFALAPVPLVTPRYVLPLGMLLMLFAGRFLSGIARLGWSARGLAIIVSMAGLAYAVSVDYLLVRDPRYAAEGWLLEHARGRTVEVYNKRTFLPRFPADVSRSQPAFVEITRSGLDARRPDFILLSMADISRVTGVVDPYEGKTRRRLENEAFLRALMAERVGYRRVAQFHTSCPLVRSGAIRSLNPEIVIYARS
jgi:4-amino-4-deoxy-L-arabinose transferase-like glycosyltransferase